MNRENWTKSDTRTCNVCGEPEEDGTATSRCSSFRCLTRDRDNNIGTTATDEDLAEYWEERAKEAEKGPSQDEVDRAAVDAFKKFKSADGSEEATQYNGAVKALLTLSTYDGFGDLRMEVEE